MAEQATETTAEVTSTEKPKKGLKIALIVIGIVAVIQLGVLLFLMKDPILEFFESRKPEPVELVLYQPLEGLSVNLADPNGRHFLRTTMTIQYSDEALTMVWAEKMADVQATVLAVIRTKTLSEIDSVEETAVLGQEIVIALNELLETEAVKSIHFTEYLYQ